MTEADRACGYFTQRSRSQGYANLWNDINGKGSWDLNPWVWALTFKRVEVPNV